MTVCNRRAQSTDNTCEHETDSKGHCVFLKIGSIEYAWDCMDNMDNWADLMGYEPTDIIARYGVSEEDAAILWLVVQSRTDYRRDFGSIKDNDEGLIPEVIREAIHQSFDGWTTRERLVIQAFLSDVAWAIHNMGIGK